MTHPCLAIRLLPIGIRGVTFRLAPARFVGDRRSGLITRTGRCRPHLPRHHCEHVRRSTWGGITSRNPLTQSALEFTLPCAAEHHPDPFTFEERHR